MLADNEKAIASIVERINNVPGVEVALGAIEREYQTKKAAYDDLLNSNRRLVSTPKPLFSNKARASR